MDGCAPLSLIVDDFSFLHCMGSEMMHWHGLGWTTEEANEAMRKIGAQEKMKATQVVLGSNHLDEAPAELMRMPGLQAPWLGDNQIRHLGWITLMRSLILLDLSDNQLETLHADIWKLVNLRQLLLSNNKLKSMPTTIRHMTALEM